MQDQIDTLRESVIMMVRSFGLLLGRKAFCADCTYAECHAIMEVAKEKNISLNELAKRLNVAKSAISRTVDALVTAGHLKREQDPGDRRYVRIKLTTQGKLLHQEIEEGSRRQFASLLASIPVDKQATVIAGIETLRAVIQEKLSSDDCEAIPARPISLKTKGA